MVIKKERVVVRLVKINQIHFKYYFSKYSKLFSKNKSKYIKT